MLRDARAKIEPTEIGEAPIVEARRALGPLGIDPISVAGDEARKAQQAEQLVNPDTRDARNPQQAPRIDDLDPIAMGQRAHYGPWRQEFWQIELADPAQQGPVGSADDRASALDREVLAHDGPRAPTGALLALEERYLKTALGQPPGCSQSSNSSTHNRDLLGRHAPQIPHPRIRSLATRRARAVNEGTCRPLRGSRYTNCVTSEVEVAYELPRSATTCAQDHSFSRG